MKPTLLILAAGIGSRYGGLKQAEGVGPSGEAILDYSIYDAIRAGFNRVVFVIRKDIEDDMRRIFFRKWEGKTGIDYVFQEPGDLPGDFRPDPDRGKPWGTGHAIWVAKDKVKEPFAVINSDDFYGREAFQKAASFLSDMDNLVHGRYCLVGYPLGNTLSEHGYVSRAECSTDKDDRLTGITERLKIKRVEGEIVFEDEEGQKAVLHDDTVVSMNFWGFMPSLFSHLETDMGTFLENNAKSLKAEFLLPDVIDRLIRQEGIEIPVLRTNAQWFGMTYQEDRELVGGRLKILVEKGIYPSPLWE